MKFVLGALLLAAAADAALTLINVKSVTPKYRSNSKRVIISYGPLTLNGKNDPSNKGSMDPKGQAGIGSLSGGLPTQATILSAHIRLRDTATGKIANPPDVYIHHMLLIPTRESKPMPIVRAAGGAGRSGFMDRGEDSGDVETVFTTPDGKYNSGYQIRSGAAFGLQYDIVNYTNNPKKLNFELEVEYLDGIVGTDAGQTLKSVDGVSVGSAVSVGKSVGHYKATSNVKILWARGHLHAGGDKMVLEVNGKAICESKPTYDNKGIITAMSLCPEIISLKAGDKMDIRSEYNLAKHKLRESTDGHGAAHGRLGGSDAMGMFALTYAMG
jgi:hypothetical protein